MKATSAGWRIVLQFPEGSDETLSRSNHQPDWAGSQTSPKRRSGALDVSPTIVDLRRALCTDSRISRKAPNDAVMRLPYIGAATLRERFLEVRDPLNEPNGIDEVQQVPKAVPDLDGDVRYLIHSSASCPG